jgi:hypothetical protein
LPYWFDWLNRDSNFPLPIKLVKKIPSEAEVKKFLASGGNPIEISLLKWNRIKEVFLEILKEPVPLLYLGGFGKVIGYKNCGLCLSSINKIDLPNPKRAPSNYKCKYCKLAEIDCCITKGSIFQEIEEITSKSYLDVDKIQTRKYLERFESLLDSMIRNLHTCKMNNGV